MPTKLYKHDGLQYFRSTDTLSLVFVHLDDDVLQNEFLHENRSCLLSSIKKRQAPPTSSTSIRQHLQLSEQRTKGKGCKRGCLALSISHPAATTTGKRKFST
eukprot:2961168-Pleurochrysis_carterae.AAC.2